MLLTTMSKLLAARGDTRRQRFLNRLRVLRHHIMKGTRYQEQCRAMARQDDSFPLELRTAGKVMVILVPQTAGVSGGVLSLFALAKELKRLKALHEYEVVLMTLPSGTNETYFTNLHFQNSESVYRFSQIVLCREAKDLYLQIPEYAFEQFFSLLTPRERRYLAGRQSLYTNILNQNIRLMPSRAAVDRWRHATDELTQSVAHHAYFNQAVADFYSLPTLLLTAYTDLSSYRRSSFSHKSHLIIYSPDSAPYKQNVLDLIERTLPHFQLREIRGISFEQYMELATECMFSITFGEGFDGYLAQPIQQGGIGFSVYNSEFFPGPDFLDFDNIFPTEADMMDRICDIMLQLSEDEQRYTQLNSRFVEKIEALYSYDSYTAQVKKLSLRQFDLFPDIGAPAAA